MNSSLFNKPSSKTKSSVFVAKALCVSLCSLEIHCCPKLLKHIHTVALGDMFLDYQEQTLWFISSQSHIHRSCCCKYSTEHQM